MDLPLELLVVEQVQWVLCLLCVPAHLLIRAPKEQRVLQWIKAPHFLIAESLDLVLIFSAFSVLFRKSLPTARPKRMFPYVFSWVLKHWSFWNLNYFAFHPKSLTVNILPHLLSLLNLCIYVYVVIVQSLCCVWLCNPMNAKAPLSTISYSLLRFLSIESVMLSNHLILCNPLLLLPSILPSIRVFSNELVLHIRCPKYWSFSFSISPSNEDSGLISFRIDLISLQSKGLSRMFSSATVWKHQFSTNIICK